ncbi:hypothetical protein C7212DRAFT_364832 [Tuber magnatum]|uniref:Nephrocystin 3-like N-terminal domain-containing protein n=1 Tax=Tuber magnatum TaxID=42249 RepID=A0A317SNC5_9PEZI|nr:hypothetical protein C7212DRAFT_364832 [Tuber magnatum]
MVISSSPHPLTFPILLFFLTSSGIIVRPRISINSFNPYLDTAEVSTIWQSSEGTSERQLSTPSHSTSRLESSMANSNLHGDYSGNTGHGNIFNSVNNNSGNITINQFGGRGTPPTDAEILQFLYTAKYESHKDRVREPARGTCIRVTEREKYKDWLGGRTPCVLWLSADPGCGKSVIAAFLSRHLKLRPDTIVCYFFFKDDTDEQKNATFALCSILHQFFRQRNTHCEYAHEAFGAKGRAFTEEVGTLWEILVKAVAEGGCGDVICVVDALDECEERTRAQLIRRIALLPRSHPNTCLKFLVTGRPYHDIATGLGVPAATIRLKGEEELNSITSDVSRVVDEGIRDLGSYWGRPGGLGYLRDLRESSADRTFLSVALVLEMLKESGGDSPGEFSHIVSTAPRNLAELYTKILDKSKNPDTAQRILHIS